MTVSTKDELERHGDIVKDIVLSALIIDGLLTGEQAAEWSKTHVVLVKKVSLISRWYKMLAAQEAPTEYVFLIGTIHEIKS